MNRSWTLGRMLGAGFAATVGPSRDLLRKVRAEA